jgi:hypothetical protein
MADESLPFGNSRNVAIRAWQSSSYMIVATIGRFGGSFDSLPTGPVIGPNRTASPQVTNWGEVFIWVEISKKFWKACDQQPLAPPISAGLGSRIEFVQGAGSPHSHCLRHQLNAILEESCQRPARSLVLSRRVYSTICANYSCFR